MARADFEKLARREDWLGKVFKIVAGRAGKGFVRDGAPRPVAHSASEVAEIREAQWEEVQLGYIGDGVDYQSPDEMLRSMTEPSEFRQILGGVKDSFYNPLTGVGMPGSDPGVYNQARTPVIMSPMEASSFYANGGIPQVIIDKKCKGVLLNGYGFEGKGWSADECKTLLDYAELLNTAESVSAGLRDGLIHGGGFLYPALKKDNPLTTPMDMDELIKAQVLGKDSISHWAEVDRWNTVLVPDWDVTAKDYLHPKTLYVPIGGVEVSTARAAIIRPRMLDYWGMIRQIGWTVSDFEGWIRPLLAYEIIIAAIPIMAQQMSLLVHTFPIDGVIAQDGADAAAQFIDKNVEAMRRWSMLNPVTINSFGELKAIERHYDGFEELVMVSRQHVAASSSIPESVIFHSQPTGFSDNKEDVLLKQSEAVKLIGESVRPQLAPVARMLAISCFGLDYVDKAGMPLMQKLRTLKFAFETPVVQTPDQLADSGVKFASLVQSLVTAQVPLDMAFEVGRHFFPGVEFPKELMDRINQESELNGGGDVKNGLREVAARFGQDIAQRLTARYEAGGAQ